MSFQSIWLLCVAVCVFGAIWQWPSFAVMASTGLLALAFPGATFGAVAFAVSALAALVDTLLMIRSAIRAVRS